MGPNKLTPPRPSSLLRAGHVPASSGAFFSTVMRCSKFILSGFLLLGSRLAALAEDVPLKYAELTLADGKTLKNVVVKSYDAKTDKFLMIADGKAMNLLAGQLPEPLAGKLKAAAPQSGASMSSTPEGKVAPAKATPDVVATPTPGNPSPAQQVSLHKASALTRAQNYYRFEFPLGSDAAKVTASNYEMDEPVAVPGWNGRYRVQGRALLEWFDSKGWSYKRSTSTFEVTTEEKDGNVKVVDFVIKS